jgi:hypothetical protein
MFVDHTVHAVAEVDDQERMVIRGECRELDLDDLAHPEWRQ